MGKESTPLSFLQLSIAGEDLLVSLKDISTKFWVTEYNINMPWEKESKR